MTKRLLLADDDDAFRERLARALERRGFDVTACDGVASARGDIAEMPPFDCAVVDLRMPDGNGLELVDALHERGSETRTVVLTGYGSIATAVQAVKRGATEYLQKPVTVERIIAALGLSDDAAVRTDDPPEAATLSRVEWEHIQRVLADCEGNISEAARRLGLHRRTLQRKLQKLPSD